VADEHGKKEGCLILVFFVDSLYSFAQQNGHITYSPPSLPPSLPLTYRTWRIVSLSEFLPIGP